MFNIVSENNLVKFYAEKMFAELAAAVDLYGVDESELIEQFCEMFEMGGNDVFEAFTDWNDAQ